MEKSPKEKVALAKQKIAFQWRFLTPKMFDLKFIEKEGVGTACTDGVHVWWDPKFIAKLTIPEVMFLITHEIFHPLRKHHIRFQSIKNLNKHVANVAMDAVINNMIVDEMGLPLPEGGVHMPKYRGWTWEKVYEDLMKNAIEIPIMWDECLPYPGRGEDSNSKGKDAPEPGSELADACESKMEDKRIDAQLKEMERIGKKAGKLPGSFSTLVGEMTETKVPWEQVLARFVDEISDKDYDWMAPDENYINGDIYIPTLHDPKIGKIGIFFDTSGSVSDDDFKKFKGGLYGILSAYDMEVFIAEIDYVVQRTYTVTSAELGNLQVKFSGRGGTSFSPGFKLIEDQDIQPKCVIYFTDGEASDFPEKAPDYSVLWALLNRGNKFEPPFGEVLFID